MEEDKPDMDLDALTLYDEGASYFKIAGEMGVSRTDARDMVRRAALKYKHRRNKVIALSLAWQRRRAR